MEGSSYDINEFPPASVDLAENIQNVPEFKQKKKIKTYTATVINKARNGIIGIDFKGYGIAVKTDKVYSAGDTVQVKYESDIGSPDFNIIELV